jgi:hypothetical protein
MEQLEAGQEAIKQLVTALLEALEQRSKQKPREWDYRGDVKGALADLCNGRGVKGRGLRHDLSDAPERAVLGVVQIPFGPAYRWWGATEPSVLCLPVYVRPALGYAERFSELARFFSELKEDFQDIGLRIARCALLEEALGVLEDELEGEDSEYLGWCVSLSRDVLDYNYAEDLTTGGLDVLGRGIETICTKGLSCAREDYRDLHKEFLGAGLALLPTSRKAQEKYDRRESGDGGEELLFS